jgi:hypothetical protein
MTAQNVLRPSQPILSVFGLEPVMSEQQFCQWMVAAKLSDRIQLPFGHLMFDRSELHSPYDPSERARLYSLTSRAYQPVDREGRTA